MDECTSVSERIHGQMERTLASAQSVLALIGLFTVLFVVLLAFSENKDWGSVGGNAQLVESPGETARVISEEPPIDRREHATARFLARQYRIAPEAATELVTAAIHAGGIVGLEPALILGVIAVESRFNPIAESEMGAKGLMQVIPRYHVDKLNTHGGSVVALDPWVNILVGAQILREYIGRTGSLEQGLQTYNGAPGDPTRQYAERVLSEKARFARILGNGRGDDKV